jgi:hypothetical protein
MPAPTPLYAALFRELDRHRQLQGLTCEAINDASGTAERSWSKHASPGSPSGRTATWPTIQTYADVLFPYGADIEIRPRTQPVAQVAPGTQRFIAQLPRNRGYLTTAWLLKRLADRGLVVEVLSAPGDFEVAA